MGLAACLPGCLAASERGFGVIVQGGSVHVGKSCILFSLFLSFLASSQVAEQRNAAAHSL